MSLVQLNHRLLLFGPKIGETVMGVSVAFDLHGQFASYHGTVSGEQKNRLLQQAHVLGLPTWYPRDVF